MDLSFTTDETAFRQQIRQWVAAHLPADISNKVHNALHLTRDDHQRWARTLGQQGWLGWGWPKAMITGATITGPKGITRGAPARAHSSSNRWRCTAFQPGPPNSLGQPQPSQPCWPSVLAQRW